MVNSILFMEFVVFIIVWPAFILPLIVSPIILLFHVESKLKRFLATLTFKPIIATILWTGILAALGSNFDSSSGWTLIPGVGLSIVVIAVFWKLLQTNKSIVLTFLGLDILRWGNTFLTITSPIKWYGLDRFISDSNSPSVGILIGILLPNIYALMALIACIIISRRSVQAKVQI